MGDLARMSSGPDLQAVLREAEAAALDPARVAARRAHEAEQYQRREAYLERVWRGRYKLAARDVAAATAWDAHNTPAVRAVHDWLPDPRRHLVLRGGVGCGKTTAACVAVKHWVSPAHMSIYLPYDEVPGPGISNDLHLRHEVAWLRPDQLVSAVLHDYDEKSPQLRRYIVLDDMGLETKADFAVALCELLDRPDHTLLITTNLTKQRIRDRYDTRVVSRLNNAARAVDLPGQSMRRQDGGF